MIRSDIFVVGLVTIYLLAYLILLQFGNTIPYAVLMLVFSPLVVAWMVYFVLKYGKYHGPELGDDEFGYLDKPKHELGVF